MSRSSLAYWTVTALRNVFDGEYAAEIGPVSLAGRRVCRVSEPTLLDMFTIRGDAERRSSGSIALVTRMTPITLVSTAVRTASRSTVVGSCGMPPVTPALLTSTSRRPARSSISAAAAATLASSVTSSGTPKASTPAARSFSTAASRRSVVPGADADAPAEGAQAGRDLVPDPLVRAGDQRDRLFAHVARSCRRARRRPPTPSGWAAIPAGYRSRSARARATVHGRGDAGAAVLRRRRRGAALRAGRAAARDRAATAVAGDPAARTAARGGAAERTSRAVTLTEAGSVLLREGRAALDAVDAADRRTRRAAPPRPASPAWSSSRRPGRPANCWRSCSTRTPPNPARSPSTCMLCGTGEQERLLRDGRADVALLHRPFDSTAGFDTEELRTEGQVVVLPAGHPLTGRAAPADGRRHRRCPTCRCRAGRAATAPTRTAPARRSATTRSCSS